MGLGSALSTAISGLNVNQTALDIIGNNLANSNTPAYKAFRTQFVNNFYSTASQGSAPSVSSAGTNPRQFGQGSRIGSIGVNFTPGGPTQTNLPSDLFIQGNGFFVVKSGNQQLYTRDGSFLVNSNAQLVNSRGQNVQGFGVDDDFNVLATSLVDLEIPLGSLTVARATETAFMEGDLNPIGELATQGTMLRTDAMTDTSTAGAATLGSLLGDITLPGTPAVPLINDATFLGGGTITMTYTPQKLGRSLPPQTIQLVGSGPNATTLGDLANFLSGSLGINVDASLSTPPAGAAMGGAGTDQLQMLGNLGAASDFSINAEDFSLSSGGSANIHFGNRFQTANGESVFSQFVVYDSLGSAVTVGATSYLENLGNETSQFRILFESADQSLDPNLALPVGLTSVFDRSVGSAQMTFNARGRIDPTQTIGNDITVHRQSTGAIDPMSFTVDVNQISALAVDNSRLAVVSQDGSPPGTLIDYSIDGGGFIIGAFDNGETRMLGQVVLARFNNSAGLIGQEGNLYREGPNSGLPFITTPGQGLGTILSGFLELSNVDVGNSFVDLLTASTGFSANSRVIATSQDLFQTLLSLPR